MGLFKLLSNSKKSKPSGSSQVFHGSTCEVEVVERADGNNVAIKRFKSWDIHGHHKTIFLQEYELLKKLEHINVVEVLKCDKRKHTITFKSLRITIYSLMKMSMLPSIEERMCWFHQLCEGLAYLHSQNIAHRDLKLENLMVDDSLCNLRIIDFGSAVDVGQTSGICHGISGSEPLMAPEVYLHLSYQGLPVDIWSLGITMYELFNNTSKPAFPWKIAKDTDEKFREYTQDPAVLSIDIPLCQKLLSIQLENRFNINDVIRSTFHKENRKCKDGSSHLRTKRILDRTKTT